jgi:ribosome-associated toxin RatA of RatAB toxin-antitoxin module
MYRPCSTTALISSIVIAISAAALLMPAAASAQDSQGAWLLDPLVQSQLAAGKAVSHNQLDDGQPRVRIDAAVRIDAPAQTVWKLLTECKYASIYIPGLRHCRMIDRAPDGSWAVIEHDIKYSALLPMVHSVFRADYRPLQQIDFHRVSGNIKSESGEWLLQPCSDHCVTVEYRVSIEPGFWVPHSMVQHSLKKQLPSALVALRVRAARMAAAAPESADAAVPAARTDSPN